MAMFRVTLKAPDFDKLQEELWQRANDAINSALRRGRIDAVPLSPVGVSPLGDSLRGNWRVEPIRLLENDRGVIRNTSVDALARMVGSPPGTRVSFAPNSPLARWAAAKGISARYVSAKIFAVGTDRWSARSNPMDLTRRGNWRNANEGFPARITEDIRRRIVRIRIG